MTKDRFLQNVTSGDCPTIKGFTLYAKSSKKHKKAAFVNFDTDERMEFANADDFYENAEIDGEKVKDIIERSEYEDLFVTTLDDTNNKMPE